MYTRRGQRSSCSPPGDFQGGNAPPQGTMFKNQNLGMTKTKGLSKFPVSAKFLLKPGNLQLFKNLLPAMRR